MIVSKYSEIDGKMYVEASDYDKILYELKNSNEKVAKIESELFDVQKSADEYYNKCIDLTNQVSELESELEVKDNLLKIKNGLCKQPMMTVVVAKTINGQDYVRLEDFISVVNDLQNCHYNHAEWPRMSFYWLSEEMYQNEI